MVWQSARTGLGGLMVLGLMGCPQECKPLGRDVLVGQIKPSVVRITYGDQRGQGTGFIIAGEAGVCTVATAAHVVKPSELISVWTHDVDTVNPGGFPARAVQSSENADLAIITFDAPGEGCPYPALTLEESGMIQPLDSVYVFGFPEGGERALYQQQVATGEVSAVDSGNAGGYDITYASQTAAGMSGGPLVNVCGEVVAVHGQEEVGFRLAVPIGKLRGELAAMLAQLPVAAEGTAQAFYEQGTALLNEKKYEEALSYFARAIDLRPNEALTWFQQGLALAYLEKYEEAIASFDRAIAINPDYADAWGNRGVALEKLGKYEEAIASLDRAIVIDPAYALAWYNRGVSLAVLEKYEEAIASYDKAIAINPDYADAWYNRGNSLAALEQHENAIISYDKAIVINPDYADAWLNRGVSFENLEQYENAIASYDKAIAINPDYVGAWFGRGIALAALEQYENAIASYDKAIAINPDDADAWYNRGLSLAALEQYENAINSYDKSIALNPSDVYVDWNSKARALSNLNRNQEALQAVNKSLEIKPDYQPAQNNRKTILEKLNPSP